MSWLAFRGLGLRVEIAVKAATIGSGAIIGPRGPEESRRMLLRRAC